MITYILSLVFAVVWVAVTGSATLHNLIFGFALSTLVLWIVRDEMGARGYWRRLGRILSLLALFLKELALSAWKVAVLVVSPRMDLKPGIFAFPLTVTRDFEITLLANLITLTPGTLSVDVSEDRKTLFVHAIDCSDIEATKRDIANGFERKIMEAFR
ncbi:MULTISPECIES: Na+/H+ antiporter subunit E [Neorhizobium]|jgi:multicomponent Na+:H+ antiporter subunit E|uniref:Multisubunit Na+/H+ antiporter, MnhE subunit n=1 Tax=Neorhizobium galegae bv. officinalis TaxID=323656 RepID=A0A0T7GD61_NEOGA|nr:MULTISPECIES: Na+/H+ antiporter subunit E [Neorhizobium]KAA9386360.1 Na+/H+ antiporter subunit E [Neorhizobium galegae]KAB1112786.1 Na+/H+ antiporter subunit E [Neorhizobium galegae]MCM2501378.1 Na+/H+ antiporter subunit E [Neorhizobium galegae]MCQ1772190.1 Na+/H+ antiporter subunit E [Neorhizobium galegae]MCQ1777630.1 Na+/H+ antiporter subunit E [Neorhizobium galegae]